MFFNFSNILHGLISEICNSRISRNSRIRIILLHQVPDFNLFFRTKNKRIPARSPNFIHPCYLRLCFLQICFNLRKWCYSERGIFIKITKCTRIMRITCCHFGKKNISVCLRSYNWSMKIHIIFSFQIYISL